MKKPTFPFTGRMLQHTVSGQCLPGVCFLTNTHTVYESDKQTDDAGCKDDNADVPEKPH